MIEICNEDVREVLVEIPEGHRHIRTRVVLQDGTGFVLQEATVANILRAFIRIKTDPRETSVRLVGKKLLKRKHGYAEWQLLEE